MERIDIWRKVLKERSRQHGLWGDQRHPDGTDPGWFESDLEDQRMMNHFLSKIPGATNWTDILYEEMMEVFSETDEKSLERELVQCMAVCCAWIEDLNRRSSVESERLQDRA